MKTDTTDAQPWNDMVDPICKRLELAAMFNQEFVFNAKGAQACADLMRAMARVLDEEVAKLRQERVTLEGNSDNHHDTI